MDVLPINWPEGRQALLAALRLAKDWAIEAARRDPNDISA
jgi:hypothetical protein